MKLYYDIETEGLPPEQIAPLMPEFEAGGNVKDTAKIQAQIEEKKKDWLDKTALKAITGKIVAVTIAKGNVEPEFHDGSEQFLIEFLLRELKAAISLNDNTYAWNAHGFDLLFLCQRAAVHNIQAFADLTSNRGGRFYWREQLIDPKLVWANYSPDHTGTSLKSVSCALGVGIKDGNGKDFAELLKTNPIEAEKYAKNDIALLRGIVQRMGI